MKRLLEAREMRWNKALVTGGAGFIGSHLVDGLIKNGIDIMVIDDLSAGLKENIKNHLDKIEFIKGDIADYELLEKAVTDVDIIFHVAANASIPTAVNDPILDYNSNARGSFNILEASRRNSVKKIVYASSAALFGMPKYFPIDEDHPTIPISPYGASKLAGESYGFAYQETYGIKFSSLRIFNAIGPRQPRYVIFDFLKKIRKNKSQLEILGTGENIRDFIYVDDVVRAFMTCADKSIADGKAYNLGTGVGTSVIELARLILGRLNLNNTKLTYTESRGRWDILKLVSNPSRLSKDLGITKFTPLTDALDDEIEWFRQNVGEL